MPDNHDKSLIELIQKLKKERNAIILVHNYQRGEVQDIGDLGWVERDIVFHIWRDENGYLNSGVIK